MRHSIVWTAAMLAGLAVAQLPAPAAYAAGQAKRISVPAGTRILVRTTEPLDSKNQKSGNRFTATLETNLQAKGMTVARRGTTVYGRLVKAKSAGRFKGSSELVLELTDIVIGGNPHPILTTTFDVKGQGEGKKTAGKVVGGTGLGAIIGGIAGGGAGAAIGAVSGAAAGTAIAGSKKGQQLMIPAESLLEFRLTQPASLPMPR